MESLPAELLNQVVPDTRGWVMLSNTSRTMRVHLRAAICDAPRTGAHIRTQKPRYIKTRAYNILYDADICWFEFHYADGRRVDGITSDTPVRDIMAVTYHCDEPRILNGVSTYEAVYALVAARMDMKPVKVTHSTPKICGSGGTPIGEIVAYATCSGVGALVRAACGTAVGTVCKVAGDIYHTFILFDDGERLGIGQYMYVYSSRILRSSMLPAQLFKKLPQLAGSLHFAELLF